jgi:hypothetical protein
MRLAGATAIMDISISIFCMGMRLADATAFMQKDKRLAIISYT